MNCSTPGFPVHHQLPELAQTHIHWVADAIQPSHPVSSPSPPALLLFPSIRAFSNESVLCIRLPEYWSFSFGINPSREYSGMISFRIDWLDLLAAHLIQTYNSSREAPKPWRDSNPSDLLKITEPDWGLRSLDSFVPDKTFISFSPMLTSNSLIPEKPLT